MMAAAPAPQPTMAAAPPQPAPVPVPAPMMAAAPASQPTMAAAPPQTAPANLTDMESTMESKLQEMMAWEEEQDKLRQAALDEAQKARDQQQVRGHAIRRYCIADFIFHRVCHYSCARPREAWLRGSGGSGDTIRLKLAFTRAGRDAGARQDRAAGIPGAGRSGAARLGERRHTRGSGDTSTLKRKR